MNRLVGHIRAWLDEAGVSVRELHGQLTEDHFQCRQVPTERKLRDLLSSDDLSWELVEAVADVCFPDESARAGQGRLSPARKLWQATLEAPTAAGGQSMHQEVLEAKNQTIAAYQEMERLRHAYQTSETGRQQAVQATMLIVALLGQAQSTIAQLKRRIDAFTARDSAEPGELEAAEQRLRRAVDQERDIQGQLVRAERERDTAQQVADHAARRIRVLEDRIALLEARDRLSPEADEPAVPRGAQSRTAAMAQDCDDEALDDADRVLDKVRLVLDQEHEAVRDAAEELGRRSLAEWGEEHGITIVHGETTAAGLDLPVEQSGSHALVSGNELSRTTLNNPPTAAAFTSKDPDPSTQDSSRLRYVGAASRRIARGLDLDEIILGLCRSAVPTFADAIAVYLRDPLPVGDERPVEPLVLRLRRAEQRTDKDDDREDVRGLLGPGFTVSDAPESIKVRLDGPLAEILRQVRPQFADFPLAAAALNELLQCDVFPSRRTIIAPLRGRRRVVGVVVLLRCADRPAFEGNDHPVAAQLATQAAVSVDKAVLYGREAYVAGQLQRAMLPVALPRLSGVQLVSRYLPAAETARVGGDWYDAIPLPGGRVALAIGDVMGHSLQSAAIMGQFRTAVQSVASMGRSPCEVLYHLDSQAQRLGHDRVATCIYAIYDPIGHRLTVANAGHPPPVLLHADGHAEVLKIPEGAPIGVGGVPFDEIEFAAPAGSTLVFYTDGLVESRLQDVWTGIGRLRQKLQETAVNSCPPPLEELCDEVLQILGPGDRDDDVALLAARFDGIPADDVAEWSLDPDLLAPSRARQLTRRTLTDWQLSHLVDSAELLVCEIITNAIRHASYPVHLRLLRTDVLRCEVSDDHHQLPHMRRAGPYDEDGRGLLVVHRMAERWGAGYLRTGKVVWFELPLQ